VDGFVFWTASCLDRRRAFQANAGVDVSLRVANNGFQNVPDYVLHAGFVRRF